MSKKTKKTLSDRLAELTSSAPSSAFNPDAPDYEDGTSAGLSRYDEDEDYDEGNDSAIQESRPSADLRVAADMESIGQEYHGKRVSRKNLEATAGDAHDPDQASEDGQSSGDSGEDDDDDVDESGDRGTAASSSRIVTSMNLDDVSSSEEEDEDEKDGVGGDKKTESTRGSEGGAGKRVHWGGQEEEEDGGSWGGGSSKRRKQPRANVFAGVTGEGVGSDVSVEGQMRQLNEQDEKARRGGGGVVGQGELRRAREALRQREWWDSLLEVRILLQRLVNAANKLPGPNELPLFLEGDEELTALAHESAGFAQGLASQLSAVRRTHMVCWGIANGKSGDNGGTDQRDAPTDAMVTDDDKEENIDNGRSNGNKGVTVADGGGEDDEAIAAKEHESCKGWWEGVLGRWHERTQLVDPSLQKKFRVVNQGPWAQITASLADRDRANRRAFMTESETAEFLGRKLAKQLKGVTSDSGTGLAAAAGAGGGGGSDDGDGDEERLGCERQKKGIEPLDLEVIDDRDLYQHLLKEFMDASGAAGGGYAGVPVRRKSRKKNVDRKASKGRKIKYVTHPKMQNFMFPQEYEPPPMESSELFASLFGGAGSTQ